MQCVKINAPDAHPPPPPLSTYTFIETTILICNNSNTFNNNKIYSLGIIVLFKNFITTPKYFYENNNKFTIDCTDSQLHLNYELYINEKNNVII